MPDRINVIEFVRTWEAAWNRRDVESVLQHFHDHTIFVSPVAQQIGFAANGVIRGKDTLRAYWNAALSKNPNLHFTVTAIYEGTDTIVITFKTQSGQDRAEILVFEQGLVTSGRGTFGCWQLPNGGPD